MSQNTGMEILLILPCVILSNINVETDIFPSDHHIIKFTLRASTEKLQKVPRVVYNYRKANWDGLRKAIIDSNLCETLRNYHADVNEACMHWTSAFKRLIDEFIPRHKYKNINSPPWIDGDVNHLSHKKETAHKKAFSNDTPESWSKCKKLR